MLRAFLASPVGVFTCSQHVRAFTHSHLKHVTCLRYAPSCFWTLHCVPLLVDRPSLLEEHLLEHLHPLLFAARSHWVALALFCTFSNTSPLVRLLLTTPFFHGSWLQPWQFQHGSQSMAVCLSSQPFWHVFHPPHSKTSMPIYPSKSRSPIHPWN